MLNILADALMIATRLGHLPETRLPRRNLRRSPPEFMEIEELSKTDHPRILGR